VKHRPGPSLIAVGNLEDESGNLFGGQRRLYELFIQPIDLVTVGSRNIAASFYRGSFSSSAFTSDLAAGLGEACNRFLVSESLYEEKRSGMLAGLVSELYL